MDNLLLPSLHSTNKVEAQQRLKELPLVSDRFFLHAGIAVQFSLLSKNRGTVKTASYASGSQRLRTFAT
jgi:hypothetical protein